MDVLHSGDVRIDLGSKRLWQADVEVILVGLPFAVLCHLVEQVKVGNERLVTKTELQRAVWRDVHVSEDTLRGCISRIRKALGDDPLNPRYIKTYAKEGWRWIAPVRSGVAVESVRTGSFQPPEAPYDPAWYVERPHEERELLDCIAFPGRPVVVFGPQGAGKRTLLARVLERAVANAPKERPPRILRISLRSFTDEHLGSLDTMLRELGRRLLDPAQEGEDRVEEILTNTWAKTIDPQLKLRRLVRSHLLADSRVVYLVLSDVDALVPWRYQSGLFDMLRGWQDAEDLAGLRLVLSSAISPRLFPLSEHSPLWTKSARLRVAELSEAQVSQLARLYGLAPAPAACNALKDLVGGLAALCRHAVFRAAVCRVPLEALLEPEKQPGGPPSLFADHLSDLEQWLELRSTGAAETPVSWEQLLRDARAGVALSSEAAWPLVRKGLLRETERRGIYRLRCALYENWLLGPRS